jgi:hypothetical protein
MTGRWTVGLAAAAIAAAGAASDGAHGVRAHGDLARSGGSSCELSRLDRARTPSTACMQCHDGSAGRRSGTTP